MSAWFRSEGLNVFRDHPPLLRRRGCVGSVKRGKDERRVACCVLPRGRGEEGGEYTQPYHCSEIIENDELRMALKQNFFFALWPISRMYVINMEVVETNECFSVFIYGMW